MKKILTLSTVLLLGSAIAAVAQLPTGGLIPSGKAIADGATQGAKDAANAQVQSAADAAAQKAVGAAGASTGGAATDAAAKAAAAQEKVDQANQAAQSARQTGDAIKGLGGMVPGGH